MSRAFLKEDTSGERPVIPPRAALPPGTPNYVTPRGLEKLREELAGMETERTRTETEIHMWKVARGAAGRLPPQGFPRDNKF